MWLRPLSVLIVLQGGPLKAMRALLHAGERLDVEVEATEGLRTDSAEH
jgi:hypothetical protein